MGEMIGTTIWIIIGLILSFGFHYFVLEEKYKEEMGAFLVFIVIFLGWISSLFM